MADEKSPADEDVMKDTVDASEIQNEEPDDGAIQDAEQEKVDTSDHGANCVCKDCRAKKIGKGGSLFPDL